VALVVDSSEDVDRCPKCGSKRIKKDMTRGEIVCMDCGFVIAENLIDFSQEWREFDSDDVEGSTCGRSKGL